jgi:hypothetical protein
MPNIVTLDQVREHLRYPAADTIDDNALLLHIAAADEVMRKECGDNVPTQYIESYDGGDTSIYLYHTPVLSVENVEEGWGWINYELDYIQVNTPPGLISMFAYSLDIPGGGKISRRTAGNINIPFMRGERNIKVVYTAGRSPVPPVIVLAELELIAHWWQNSQQRAAAGITATSFDSTNQDFPRSGAALFTPINQGVPYRILEMIKVYRAMPIIG